MSSASSVASSFSSLGSSSSSTPAFVGSAPPPNPAVDLNDEDGEAYSDDFAAAEEAIEESVRLTLEPSSEYGNRVDHAEDDDNYDDDAFEVSDHSDEKRVLTEQEDRYAQAEHTAEYSDVFEYSEDFVDGNEGTAPSNVIVKGTQMDTIEVNDLDSAIAESTLAPGTIGLGMQHPGENLDSLAGEWAASKLRWLAQRSTKPASRIRASSPERCPKLHEDASASLLQRLRKRRPSERKPGVVRSRPHWPRVPTPVIDRVHVHKLLALSSQLPPPAKDSTPRQARSLSTFCSVKTADLEGKLATQRLGDLCARWETSGDHALSAATSEFLAPILAQQRRVLRPGHDDSVLGVLRTHATAMERAVQTATLAVSDSRQLWQHAHNVLHAVDAHACTCSP